MFVATRYLEHLSETDLAVLGESAGVAPVGDPAAYFRRDPERVEAALREPAVFARMFGAADAGELLVRASPFLVFAVAVHRGVEDLRTTPYVAERIGRLRAVPVFDTAAQAEFAGDPARRLFLVEHLASYTHVASGPVWVRRGNRWRRHRFSELDPARLAATLPLVPAPERPGIYRRLGDVALLLTGVFADHVFTRPVASLELDRLVRSVGGTAAAPPDLEQIGGGAGAAAVLEVLGPTWYRLAAQGTPIAPVARELRDVADRFGAARRFLNLLTDRYLLPWRDRWLPAPGP